MDKMMEKVKDAVNDAKDAVNEAMGSSSGKRTALMILSDGAEESEVVVTSDVLNRGGIKVTIAGFSGENAVKCCQGVMIKPEMSLDKAADQAESAPFDIIIIPGGPKGTKNMEESVLVGQLLKKQEMRGGLIGAICGGPMALRSHSVGVGKCVTAHKSKWDEMNDGKHKVCKSRVCIDGNIITSQGPGTAMEFGLAIVEKLVGSENIPKLKEDLAMVC